MAASVALVTRPTADALGGSIDEMEVPFGKGHGLYESGKGSGGGSEGAHEVSGSKLVADGGEVGM